MRKEKTHILLGLLLILSSFCAQEKPNNEILIVGHRGAAGHAPENTIASIELAIELGANAIEIDLRQTKDGIPVALHDSDIDRTTDGCGEVSDLTFNELQKLDAGSWFDNQFTGERIPSLIEVIDALSDSTILIIEFKGGLGTYNNIEKRTLEIISKNRITNRVILKSFDPDQLDFIKTLNSSLPLLYVYAVRIPWLYMIIDTGISFGSVYDFKVEYLQPHLFLLSDSFVDDAKQKGYKIIAWGVDEIDEIKEALNMGVDGIETNYPDRVRELLESSRNKR